MLSAATSWLTGRAGSGSPDQVKGRCQPPGDRHNGRHSSKASAPSPEGLPQTQPIVNDKECNCEQAENSFNGTYTFYCGIAEHSGRRCRQSWHFAIPLLELLWVRPWRNEGNAGGRRVTWKSSLVAVAMLMPPLMSPAVASATPRPGE
jgi:hypothetical protein